MFSTYKKIPKPDSEKSIFMLNVEKLRPSQFCVGFAEVLARKEEFFKESNKERLNYLRSKPTPIVVDRNDNYWMLDRHHRLRALMEIDNNSKTFGYVVAEVNTKDITEVLDFLGQQGWLYLYDGRGRGPLSPKLLPSNLMGMTDDPFRSLVWKLKKQGLIKSQPLIPYYEFRWSRWLRKKPFPPFTSMNLSPAISTAKRIVNSEAASKFTKLGMKIL